MWDLKFPDKGSNPHPLHWKHRVLNTGLPGKSQYLKKKSLGNSLVVQWLGLHASNAGDMGLIPGQVKILETVKQGQKANK